MRGRAAFPGTLGILLLLVSPAAAHEPVREDSGKGAATKPATEAPLTFDPPHAPEAVFALMEDLRDADPATRIAAALALRELGELAFPALPILEEMLEDPVMGVRKAAAGALGGMGPTATSAVPALARRLNDPHRFVRSWAAMALSEIGPSARAATPALVAMLEEDRENLRGRAWCAAALPRVEAPPDRAVPALVRALARDPSEEVRAVAVLSIEKYGRDAAAHDALPALLEALDDSFWKVRGNAACALPVLLESDDSRLEMLVSPLAARLRDDSAYVRGCALRSLGRLGAPALRVRSEIEALLSDEDPHVRRRARKALDALADTTPATP